MISNVPAAPVHMRLKISVPRVVTTWPFGPADFEVHVTAAVPEPMDRPRQTTVPRQSDDHVFDVVNTARRWAARTRPAKS